MSVTYVAQAITTVSQDRAMFGKSKLALCALHHKMVKGACDDLVGSVGMESAMTSALDIFREIDSSKCNEFASPKLSGFIRQSITSATVLRESILSSMDTQVETKVARVAGDTWNRVKSRRIGARSKRNVLDVTSSRDEEEKADACKIAALESNAVPPEIPDVVC